MNDERFDDYPKSFYIIFDYKIKEIQYSDDDFDKVNRILFE